MNKIERRELIEAEAMIESEHSDWGNRD